MEKHYGRYEKWGEEKMKKFINLSWDYKVEPHLLLEGKTGTGKSTFIQTFLEEHRGEKVSFIIDSRIENFDAINDVLNDVNSLMKGRYELLKRKVEEPAKYDLLKREKENPYLYKGRPIFLVIDDFNHLIKIVKEKFDYDSFEQILRKGRSVNIHILITIENINLKRKINLLNNFTYKSLNEEIKEEEI